MAYGIYSGLWKDHDATCASLLGKGLVMLPVYRLLIFAALLACLLAQVNFLELAAVTRVTTDFILYAHMYCYMYGRLPRLYYGFYNRKSCSDNTILTSIRLC